MAEPLTFAAVFVGGCLIGAVVTRAIHQCERDENLADDFCGELNPDEFLDTSSHQSPLLPGGSVATGDAAAQERGVASFVDDAAENHQSHRRA